MKSPGASDRDRRSAGSDGSVADAGPAGAAGGSGPSPDTARREARRRGAEGTELDFRVATMDCPTCVRRIAGHLEGVEGVFEVSGSPVHRTLTVRFDEGLLDGDRIRHEVGRLGYGAAPLRRGEDRISAGDVWLDARAARTYASGVLMLAGLVLRLLGVGPVLLELPLQEIRTADLLFLAGAAVGGWNFFPRGVRSARTLSLDMNFLMTIAIVGAVIVGEHLEAGAIAFLFSIAELLERYSVDRARRSVEALMDLAPDTARVIREGEEVVVPAADLVPGDVVVISPGERIPADGRVEEGTAAVDQSTITGESMPVDLEAGAEVFAGTIVRNGFLRIQVEREAGGSMLARIIALVEEAETGRTRSERFVDAFARRYTPAVTAGAILVVAVPPLFFGAPFVEWFVRGLTLLVIACPCALVISTPVSVVSGVTAAARRGVLIKGGHYLEAAGEVEVVAFDKTGTLTLGHPDVVELAPEIGVTEEELLEAAAEVESRSEHPIGRAVVRAAAHRGWSPGGAGVEGFESLPGRGARARVDGVEHLVGRPDTVLDGQAPPAVARMAEGGRTVVGVTRGGNLVGWIALADPPRPGAMEVVAQLRKAGIRRVVMLTGDNLETARAVGRAVGVDEVRAGLLPDEKVKAIRELEVRWGPVAMVGDGVNDGPALAASRVGIAMGAAGSDTALETADVALMGDDLERVPYLIHLSRRANRVIRQNVVASIAVKGLLAIGVPLGMVTLVVAVVVGDLGVSLAVTANALRLGRRRGDLAGVPAGG